MVWENALNYATQNDDLWATDKIIISTLWQRVKDGYNRLSETEGKNNLRKIILEMSKGVLPLKISIRA